MKLENQPLEVSARQLAYLAITNGWDLWKLYDENSFQFTTGQQEDMYKIVSMAVFFVEEYWYSRYKRNAV